MKKRLIALFTVVLTSFMLMAFAPRKVDDPGTVGLWHQKTMIDGEQAYVINSRLKYHWGNHQTGSKPNSTFPEIDSWTVYFGDNLLTETDFEIHLPGDEFNKLGIEIRSYDYDDNLGDPVLLKTIDATSVKFVATQTDGYKLKVLDNEDNVIYAARELELFRIYYYVDVSMPNEPTHTVADLPETSGSIFTQQMNMGRVYFQPNSLNLNLAVYYNGQSYYLNFGFAPNTDMTVFNNTYESFYYTHEGQKFIVINHGDTSMFLPDGSKDTFVPYTIWNLNTNELQTINRFSTYLYSKKEAANNVYAYFYVDEFVIDNLLSISLAYKYRYNFLIGDGDWHDQYVYLENNVNATGLSPTAWQFDVMTGTAAAMLAGSQIPVLRWPILAFGTAVMATVGSTVDEQIIEFGNIEQIQKITSLNTDLENELLQAFNKADTNFDDFNNPVFKLHLGQFNALFSTGIEIDQEYSVVDGQKGINIIQFTYQTKGQVYTIDGSNINVEFTPGPGTDGQSGSILDNIITIGIVVIAGLVLLSLLKQGVFTNTKKLKAFIISLVVFAIIGFVIYYLVTTGGSFSFNLVT